MLEVPFLIVETTMCQRIFAFARCERSRGFITWYEIWLHNPCVNAAYKEFQEQNLRVWWMSY